MEAVWTIGRPSAIASAAAARAAGAISRTSARLFKAASNRSRSAGRVTSAQRTAYSRSLGEVVIVRTSAPARLSASTMSVR